MFKNDSRKNRNDSRRTKKVEHWNLYKKLRNCCNNKTRYAKSSFHDELLKSTSNPRKFWSIIKDIFLTKPKSMVVNSNRQNDPKQPCIFSTYYASVVQLLKKKSMPLVDFDTTFNGFKSGLLKHYKSALRNVYNAEDPRTWKSICLSCNTSRNLSCPISCCS